MEWKLKHRTLDLDAGALIMGILNVTPDSFSDGGSFIDPERAVAHAEKMLAEGAAIIDIGGESTRPGAADVSTKDEIARVVPVIEQIRQKTDALISIDTSKSRVAEAAVDAGAEIINDVTGLKGDPKMAEIVAKTGAGFILMHMQGTPRTMQKDPTYADVVADIQKTFSEQIRVATHAGVSVESIVLDPGIGFGKTLEHNLEILRRLPDLEIKNRPLLLGVSRKSFIGRILESDDLDDRHWPTIGLTSFAVEKGCKILRVHAIKENHEALRMTEAILSVE